MKRLSMVALVKKINKTGNVRKSCLSSSKQIETNNNEPAYPRHGERSRTMAMLEYSCKDIVIMC